MLYIPKVLLFKFQENRKIYVKKTARALGKSLFHNELGKPIGQLLKDSNQLVRRAAYSKNNCILIECSIYELDRTGILSYFFSVSYF